MAKQNEINGLQQQLQQKATQYRLETRNVLTPEQRAEMEQYPSTTIYDDSVFYGNCSKYLSSAPARSPWFFQRIRDMSRSCDSIETLIC